MIKNCLDALTKARSRARIRSSIVLPPLLEAAIADNVHDEHADFVRAIKDGLSADCYTMFSCHEIQGILDFEQQLSSTWDDFEALVSVEWGDIRSFVDPRLAGTLLVYSMRMSMLVVRNRDKRRLRDAVMGLVVDKDLLDYRDLLTIASLAYDAALRIGADPKTYFRRAIRYATADRRQLLETYLDSPSHMKSIESMGCEAVESEFGFVYRLRFD